MILKKKIAFYLNNSTTSSVDLSFPEFGNPGLGGTEFLLAATPYYINKYHSDKFEIFIFAHNIENLPNGLITFKVENIEDAIVKASVQGIDFFIYRPLRDPQPTVLSLLQVCNLTAIAWLHVTPKSSHLRFLANSSKISAVVCVEHEQHDQLYDSPLGKKLTYIVNGFDVGGFRRNISFEEKDLNLVVHIGAIVPQKSFHVLARNWPKIVERCPDARLIVIGSASVYDEQQLLGDWGVGYKSYEDNFIKPYLSDEHGALLSSVKFMGKMGLDKREYMAKAIVGIANPVGTNENCPATSLEFQALGTPVVGQANYGNLDTILHGETGLLADNENDFVEKICLLLEKPSYAKLLGKHGPLFVQHKYSWEKVGIEWVDLFNAITNKVDIRNKSMKKNYLKHKKIFIFLNSIFQVFFGKYFKWPFLLEIQGRISKWR